MEDLKFSNQQDEMPNELMPNARRNLPLSHTAFLSGKLNNEVQAREIW
jgi:hypothetical protein